MGYNTIYEFKFHCNHEKEQEMRDFVAKHSEWSEFPEEGEPIKYCDWQKDFTALSAAYPNEAFEVIGQGEEHSDHQKAFFLGGRYDLVHAEIMFHTDDPSTSMLYMHERLEIPLKGVSFNLETKNIVVSWSDGSQEHQLVNPNDIAPFDSDTGFLESKGDCIKIIKKIIQRNRRGERIQVLDDEILLIDHVEQPKRQVYVPPKQLEDKPWMLDDGEFCYIAVTKLIQDENMELIRKGLQEGEYQFVDTLLCYSLGLGNVYIAELALEHPINQQIISTMPYQVARDSKDPKIRALLSRIQKQMNTWTWDINKHLLLK